MFVRNKRLMYTVRVSEPNPRLASLMLEQFGGPDGELAAAMRYFTQAIGEDDPNRKDMLLDIATEELSHLEVIGSIVAMLSKGVKAKMAEGTLEQGELMRDVFHGGESHTFSTAGARRWSTRRECPGRPPTSTRKASRRPTCDPTSPRKREQKSSTSG